VAPTLHDDITRMLDLRFVDLLDVNAERTGVNDGTHLRHSWKVWLEGKTGKSKGAKLDLSQRSYSAGDLSPPLSYYQLDRHMCQVG
jgi:hypothetical protein